MQKLIIKKFNDIEELSLELKKLVVLGGMDRANKTAIHKMILFFRSCREVVYDILEQDRAINIFFIDYFINRMTSSFLNDLMYGSPKLYQDFDIIFKFTEDCFARIQFQDDNVIKLHFSDTASFSDDAPMQNAKHQTFLELLDDIEAYRVAFVFGQDEKWNYKDAKVFSTKRYHAYKNLTQRIDEFFGDKRSFLAIPALKEVALPMSSEIRGLRGKKEFRVEGLMAHFFRFIRRPSLTLSSNFRESIKRYKKFVDPNPSFPTKHNQRQRYCLAQAEFINGFLESELLKGYFDQSRYPGHLFTDDGRGVTFDRMDSSLQSIFYILSLCFTSILEDQSWVLLLEEPEGHLNPEEQKRFTQFLMFWLKHGKHTLLLSTQSAHVLATLNTMLYAKGIIEQEKEPTYLADAYLLDERFLIDRADIEIFELEEGTLLPALEGEPAFIPQEIITRLLGNPFADIEALHQKFSR